MNLFPFVRPMLGGLLFSMTATAFATPIYYDSKASFDAATSALSFNSESFTSVPDDSFTLDLASGLNVDSSAVPMNQFTGALCGNGSSDLCGIFNLSDSGPLSNTLTFTFDDGPVSAFGIFLLDVGASSGPTTVSITSDNGGILSFVQNDYPNNPTRFLGVTDLMAPMSSISITAAHTLTFGIGGDGILFDDAQWSTTTAVSEPINIVLFSTGLVLLVASRKRRDR